MTRLLRMSALRQSLLLALAFVVMTVIAGFLAVSLISDALIDNIDDQLLGTAQALGAPSAAQNAARRAHDDQDQAIGFLAADGEVFGRFSRAAFAELGERSVFGDDVGLEDDDWRLLVVETDGGRLAIATELEPVSETIRIVTSTLGTVLAVTLVACLAIGLAIGLRAQVRLRRMLATLDRFASGDLTARTNAENRKVRRPDDLDHAAQRIDETLDRLQALVEQMRHLSANLAHELKTPLARLRVSVEALATNNAALPQPGAIDGLLDETDRVIRIFDALLRIAQLDTGARRDRFVEVDLATLATELSSLYRPVVEGSGRTLETAIDGPAIVHGDRDLLSQLIANLLENAVAHTPDGSTIGLQVFGKTLTVWDNGPGIAPDERERVLEPFYRTDTAGAGSGLGLAMVRAIVDLHGARITLADGPSASPGRPGLSISVAFMTPRLPQGREPQPA